MFTHNTPTRDAGDDTLFERGVLLVFVTLFLIMPRVTIGSMNLPQYVSPLVIHVLFAVGFVISVYGISKGVYRVVNHESLATNPKYKNQRHVLCDALTAFFYPVFVVSGFWMVGLF